MEVCLNNSLRWALPTMRNLLLPEVGSGGTTFSIVVEHADVCCQCKHHYIFLGDEACFGLFLGDGSTSLGFRCLVVALGSWLGDFEVWQKSGQFVQAFHWYQCVLAKFHIHNVNCATDCPGFGDMVVLLGPSCVDIYLRLPFVQVFVNKDMVKSFIS